MRVIKEGSHRLFEEDMETTQYVQEMLRDLKKNGMDAVRKYSKKFDYWNPTSFELSEQQIKEAISKCDDQLIKDTDYCQNNVRDFARAQLATMSSLKTEIRHGIILGHKHIPVNSVGIYVPGGRYPMFGSAQMSNIPAKVAGVKTVVGFTHKRCC
jgi:sulfopropanediol 3-dehydrogenase